MDTAKIKTMVAGIWGGGSAGGTWLAWLCSDQLGNLLRNLAMLIGFLSACASIVYLVKINRLRERIKLMDEVRAETRMCSECLLGKQPAGNCPVPFIHRPKDCPKGLEKRGKVSALQTWRKKWGLNFSDETTKT